MIGKTWRKLKHSLFLQSDLPIAVTLITITLAFGLVGWILWDIVGLVGGVLAAMLLTQLLDIIP